MSEIVSQIPTQVTGISDEKQAIVLVLLAKREVEGEVKPLTPSQATAALGNAKATLETIDGTEVLGTSTAILLPAVELQEGETLTLNVDAAIVKNDVETVE